MIWQENRIPIYCQIMGSLIIHEQCFTGPTENYTFDYVLQEAIEYICAV